MRFGKHNHYLHPKSYKLKTTNVYEKIGEKLNNHHTSDDTEDWLIGMCSFFFGTRV
jgi:hypothetical protein